MAQKSLQLALGGHLLAWLVAEVFKCYEAFG